MIIKIFYKKKKKKNRMKSNNFMILSRILFSMKQKKPIKVEIKWEIRADVTQRKKKNGTDIRFKNRQKWL